MHCIAMLSRLFAGPHSWSHAPLDRSPACADEGGGQSGQEANVLHNLINIAAQAVNSQAPFAGVLSTIYCLLKVVAMPCTWGAALFVSLMHVVIGMLCRGTAADR